MTAYAYSQKYYCLHDATPIRIFESDSLGVSNELANLQIDLIKEGYIFNSIDSIVPVNKDSTLVYLYKGTRVSWKSISVEDPNLGVTRNLKKKNLDDLIRTYSSQGYPFVSIIFTDLKPVSSRRYTAQIEVVPNARITFDSLVLSDPNLKIKSTYLNDVTRIRPGDPFNEILYEQIEKRIENEPGIHMLSPPDLSFSNNMASVYLDIARLPASSFEGILGWQSDGDRSFATGFIDLELNNLFNSGKYLALDWRRFQIESQQLGVDFAYPYIGHSAMDLKVEIDLLKQDSSFINQQYLIQLDAGLGPFNSLGFFYNLDQSFQTDEQSTFESFKTNWYGLQYTGGNRLREFGRGNRFGVQTSLSIGEKQVDNDKLFNFRLKFSTNIAVPFLERSQVNTTLGSNLIRNERINQNELFRIGGLKSIRGFLENEFFAQWFTLFRNEYRFYFENQSYLLALFDGGYIQNSLAFDRDLWLGAFGGGMAINVKNGRFSLIFAEGFTNMERPRFDDIKVHFGYISNF
jgi:hypothetical protein